MTSSPVRRCAAGVALLLLGSCSQDADLLLEPQIPASLVAEAVGLHSVRVSWTAVQDPKVARYRLERRSDLQGDFAVLAETVPQVGSGTVIYFDTSVEPETYYGYRATALTRLGEPLGESVIGGAKTPPPPGINVRVTTSAPNETALDVNGYTVTIEGPDTAAGPLGLNGTRLFTPLAAGSYRVTLRGAQGNCGVADDSVRTVQVTDQSVQTVAAVSFNVSCRDPNRGRITVATTTTGDSLDADGYRVVLTGIASDPSLPESEKVISHQGTLGTTSSRLFDDLRPGRYEVRLEGVAGNCAVQGQVTRTLDLAALGDETVSYAIGCAGSPPDPTGRPFVWRNEWMPSAAMPGQAVVLNVTLDLAAEAGANVGAVQEELGYDQTVIRYDSIVAGRLGNIFDNGSTPGTVTWGAFTTATSGRSGAVLVGQVYFTVIGTTGQSATTRSRTIGAADAGGTRITDKIHVVEATLTVGAGAGTSGGMTDGGTTGATGSTGGNASDGATNGGPTSGGSTPFTWSNTWSPINAANRTVTLTMTLDLSTNISETPDVEQLLRWVLSELRWDPAILRFRSFNYGSQVSGGNNQTFVSSGRLLDVAGTHSPSVNSTGVIGLATIAFDIVGTSGMTTTTTTVLNSVTGTAATGGFDYTSRVRVVEGTLAIP